MDNFQQITPFLHVEDLQRALDFFTHTLGFKRLRKMGPFAYVERETVGVRLLQNRGADRAPPGTGWELHRLRPHPRSASGAFRIDARTLGGFPAEACFDLRQKP